MSARLLPLGGEGVCPDLTMAGAGEREEYAGTARSAIGLIRAGLPWYPPPTRGVGEGVGTWTGLDWELPADEVVRPPCRIDCLLF
jgi:hypothetical protein